MDDVTYKGDITYMGYVTYMGDATYAGDINTYGDNITYACDITYRGDATYATFYDCFELNTMTASPEPDLQEHTQGVCLSGFLVILGHAQQNRVRTLKA